MKRLILIVLVVLSSALSLPEPKKSENVISLPPGLTIVDKPIVLKSGDVLIGNNSTLKLADNANCPVIIVGDASDFPERTEGIFVSNLTIDGNKQNQPWENGQFGELHLRANGVSVRNSHQVYIHNVKVKNARSGGIVVERGSSNVIITDSEFSHSSFDGIAAYESTGVFIENVICSNNEFAGMSFDLKFTKNLISKSILSNNGHQGIFIRDSEGNYFTNIICENNGKQGIFVAESELGPAINNLFIDFSFTGNSQIMHVADESCKGNKLINPQIDTENWVSWQK